MKEDMTVLDWARLYRSKGWSVVPVWSPAMFKPAVAPKWFRSLLKNKIQKSESSEKSLSKEEKNEILRELVISQCKIPRVGWKKYQEQLPTEEEITEWWTKWPNANVGIITGKVSGIVVLDLDDPEKATEFANGQGGFPETVTAASGKGFHGYYLRPEGKYHQNIKDSDFDGQFGMDTRCDGGFIVAPLSEHGSGRKYEWVEGKSPLDIDLAPCEIWMIEWMESCYNHEFEVEVEEADGEKVRKTFSYTEKRTLQENLERKVYLGERDNTATSIVGGLVAMRLPTSVVKEQIEEWNYGQLYPLTNYEIKKIVKSVLKMEKHSNAKKVINVKDNFEKFTDNFEDNIEIAREYVYPALAELEDPIQEDHYINKLKNKLGGKKEDYRKEIEKVRKWKKKNQPPPAAKTVPQDIEQEVQKLQQNPLAYIKRINTVNDLGLAGERSLVGMILSTLDSRLLEFDRHKPQTMVLKIQGDSSAGKSIPVEYCCLIYSDRKELYLPFTSASDKAIYHEETFDFKHKCLVLSEALKLEYENEFNLAIRSLISSGSYTYLYVEKDEIGGGHKTIEKSKDGPTSCITTTTADALETQWQSRCFDVHPDHSDSQTRSINMLQSDEAEGDCLNVPEKIIEVWRHYHRCLQPRKVIIPYASKIEVLIAHRRPVGARREFPRILSMIKTIACFYQHQRQKDGNGYIVAELIDYYIAEQILRGVYEETVSGRSEEDNRRLSILAAAGPQKLSALENKFGISYTTASRWVGKMVESGQVCWCDLNGNPFLDPRAAEAAKRTGNGLVGLGPNVDLMTEIKGLPSVYDITKTINTPKQQLRSMKWSDLHSLLDNSDGDRDWRDDGTLHREYSLDIDKKYVGPPSTQTTTIVTVSTTTTITFSTTTTTTTQPPQQLFEPEEEQAEVNVGMDDFYQALKACETKE